ncbi:MAG: hypothetical protein GY896_23050 [Gammaproteobacteria bacterium]|nr:hypothetical protein [Gammaproteobacteria bacterium]
MAKRFYEPVSGDLVLWSDPAQFEKTQLEAELALVEQYQGYDDTVRTIIATCSGFDNLQAFDDDLTAKRTRLKDLIDFFDYSNTPLALNVKDGAWFTPIAVQGKCGEEVGHEAILTIDGSNTTYWEHAVGEAHQITWQLRDYRKRIGKLQVRIASSDRNLLTGIDIYIADNVDGLDSPGNLIKSGVNLVVPNSWEEIPFISKGNGQYIRFTGFGSQHASNEVRIQEIQAWVVTVEYD